MVHNLFRLRADGTVAWTISQPEAMGVVINIEWRYGRLAAWTFGCYMLVIDARNGRVLNSVFTK